MKIPNFLDGALVIEFAVNQSFGLYQTESGKFLKIKYLAICTYGNDNEFYIFACDENNEVIGDTVHTSKEEARIFAKSYYKDEDKEINWDAPNNLYKKF
jgi:hypothetical protein